MYVRLSINTEQGASASRCPSACEIENFSPEISSARLSSDDVDSFIALDSKADMQARYQYATEIRARLDEEKMARTFNMVYLLIQSLQTLATTLRFVSCHSSCYVYVIYKSAYQSKHKLLF